MRDNPPLSDQLKKLNPLLSNINGIYQNASTKVLRSSLDHYIHYAVDHLYETSNDLSLFSLELERLLQTNELRDAISPAPVNFLLSFRLDNVKRVLDLTQDFGGVSHYLASHAEHVDSIKIDFGKATLSAKRCAALDNITFISEVLPELAFANSSYDLIIIGQLEELEVDKQQQIELITALGLALNSTGRLVINAENQTKVNKWTSPGQTNIDFSHLYHDQTKRLFTYEELTFSLKTAGFLHWKPYASFSLGKSINNLFSLEYLERGSTSLNHFNRLGGLGNEQINEYLTIKNLNNERGAVFDLASRFVVIASASELRSEQLCKLNFAHFSGTSRKPQWRTTTLYETGSNTVMKIPVHPAYSTEQENNSILSQCTDPQNFIEGTLLLEKWLNALVSDEPTNNLEALISEYASWLNLLEKEGKLNGKTYDALPFNIIVDQHDGEHNFNIIDPEWDINAEFGANFILFRALFWFAFENKKLLTIFAKDTGLATIGLFVSHYLSVNESSKGVKDKHQPINDLSSFIELEELIQRQIASEFHNKSVEYALLQTFDGESLTKRLQPACQISWGDVESNFDESNSVFIKWNMNTELQTLNSETPVYQESKSVLRIDPIASLGFFEFASLALSNNKGKTVWQLTSSQEIATQAELVNLSYSEETGHFIAINDDPHFLFNLEQLENREEVNRITLCLSLVHNEYYDASLSTLSDALIQQGAALSKQTSSLGSVRAELKFLKSNLDDIDQHRQDLQQNIYNAQVTLRETREANQKHVQNLTIELQAQATVVQTQAARIQEFESIILARYYVRAKRIVKRIAKKLIGRS